MNVRHLMGVLNSFSLKNIFHNKMDLRLFYFYVTVYSVKVVPGKLRIKILFTQSSFTEVSSKTKRLLF